MLCCEVQIRLCLTLVYALWYSAVGVMTAITAMAVQGFRTNICATDDVYVHMCVTCGWG